MMLLDGRFVFLTFLIIGVMPQAIADTLPRWTSADIPPDVSSLWANYNPDAEPLEVEVVHEWQRTYEGRDITVRMLVYTIGTFKGVPSRMGAYYAFPNHRDGRVPGLIQMHGGGQRAMPEIVEAAAANGYACIAINWGGKAMADQAADDPGTDWGAVDATQSGHNSHYGSCMPDDKTLDDFESPRNSNWYLIILAAKRAVTLLQQQPEVDPDRIGALGHSMGGKLTVMLAGSDSRIKATAPSCGGVGSAPACLRERPGNAARPENKSEIYGRLIDDRAYIPHITCPIVYLGPQNDFNGLFDELFTNWEHIGSKQVAFAISKHLNHRHEKAASFVEWLWFEQVLKGTLTLPETPSLSAQLKGNDGIPVATVEPDCIAQVEKVDIFYSIDPNGQFRFWRTAVSKRVGRKWIAECPILSTDMPLFFMANVYYRFPDIKLVGPPWNSAPGATYLLSTRVLPFDVNRVKDAGPKPTDTVDRMIERDFGDLQDWYLLDQDNAQNRQMLTRKVKDPKWRGPNGAALAIDVQDPRGGSVVVYLEFNSYSQYGRESVSGDYYAELPFEASPDWQTLQLRVEDLKPSSRNHRIPDNWQTLCALTIRARHPVKSGGEEIEVGAGKFDAERKLRNLRWIGGVDPESVLMPGSAGISLAPEAYQAQFQNQIDQSIELEREDRQTEKSGE